MNDNAKPKPRPVFVILYTQPNGQICSWTATFRDIGEAKREGEFLFRNDRRSWFVAQAKDPD